MPKRSLRMRLDSAARSLLEAAIETCLGGFRPKNALEDPLSAPTPQSLSDFGKISMETVRLRLVTTFRSCAEICRHSAHLERPYRRRRRWLARWGMRLAGGRLLASSRTVLQDQSASRFSSPEARALATAAALGLCLRLLRCLLIVMPTEAAARLDDAALRGVILLVHHTQACVQELDLVASDYAAKRRRWLDLEVHGRAVAGDEILARSHAAHEISWVAHTCFSRLILLSTLRDNNTGIYHHPDLSRKFSARIVNETLSRMHRETCEEVLKYPFADLVDEIEVYADQTRSGRHRLLSAWRNIRAYRTVRPAELDAFSSLCFELTLDLALAALERRSD
jgi:hypothetical protein